MTKKKPELRGYPHTGLGKRTKMWFYERFIRIFVPKNFINGEVNSGLFGLYPHLFGRFA